MATYPPGTQLRSTVDETEVVVVAAGSVDVELRCGGAPMLPRDEVGEPAGAPDPDLSDGTQLGKRYAHEPSGLELLVTRPGSGTLQVNDDRLEIKQAKPLPSSD